MRDITLQDIHNYNALQCQKETAERVTKLNALVAELTANFNDPLYGGF